MASTDYNAKIENLGMGDFFKLEEHGAVRQVAWVDDSVDGSVGYFTFADGTRETLAMLRRCFLTRKAPRCGCGRRFENCEQECMWPGDMEALFSVV